VPAASAFDPAVVFMTGVTKPLKREKTSEGAARTAQGEPDPFEVVADEVVVEAGGIGGQDAGEKERRRQSPAGVQRPRILPRR